MHLTFTASDHCYHVDGRVVDSVTSLIQRAGRGPDYAAVPDFILERARQRGTHVHAACELLAAGALDWDTVHTPWRGYVQAWERFLTTHTVKIISAMERPIYHPELDYAGTPDAGEALVDGDHVCLDVKTSKEIHADPYGLQLAAYTLPGVHSAMADGELVPYDPPARRLIVQLKADGTVALHWCEDREDHDDWRAVVRLARRAGRYPNGKARCTS